MRGVIMRMWTKQEHIEILTGRSNKQAAQKYTSMGRGAVSHQLVRYWRKIFIDFKGVEARANDAIKAERRLAMPTPARKLFGPPKFASRIMVIPDLHAPYHHPDALAFLAYVKAKLRPSLVVNLGDELDFHALSFHDSDPNLDSAGMELERGKAFLHELAELFPKMLLCDSNHGSMVFRRAKAHGIPVQAIKGYYDVIFDGDVRPDWKWAENWRLSSALGDILFKHQSAGIVGDAAHNSCNLVVGHSHGNFSIEYAASSSRLYYGMYSGCLIDRDAMAFAYGKHTLKKPIIGCSVIIDGVPSLIPMLLNDSGRWVGERAM